MVGRCVAITLLLVGCGKVKNESAVDAPVQPGDDAPAIDAPDIDAPPPTKKVFISSLTFFPDFGGTTQADAACQNMANGAGLPGAFRAWLSVATDPVLTRFTHATVPYVLVDGTRVANDFTDLTSGQLRHGIDLTENGQPLADTGITDCHGAPTCAQTFTATNADGTADTTNDECLNWTTRIFQNGTELNTFLGGDSTMAGREWTVRASGFRCDFQARIYCFQQ